MEISSCSPRLNSVHRLQGRHINLSVRMSQTTFTLKIKLGTKTWINGYVFSHMFSCTCIENNIPKDKINIHISHICIHCTFETGYDSAGYIAMELLCPVAIFPYSANGMESASAKCRPRPQESMRLPNHIGRVSGMIVTSERWT